VNSQLATTIDRPQNYWLSTTIKQQVLAVAVFSSQPNLHYGTGLEIEIKQGRYIRLHSAIDSLFDRLNIHKRGFHSFLIKSKNDN
jgi:hypothetical protein